MADFNVVLSDLKSFGGTLHRQAHDYRGLRSKVSPPVADGGDSGLNESIKAVSDLIAGLHEKLALRMDAHAEKIKHAHDSYQRHDIEEHGVFDDLTDGMGEGLSK